MNTTNISTYFEHFIQECERNFNFLSYFWYGKPNVNFIDGKGNISIENSHSVMIEYRTKLRTLEITYVINSLDEEEITSLKSRDISTEHILIYVRNRRMKSLYDNYISLSRYMKLKHPNIDLKDYGFCNDLSRLKNIERVLYNLSGFMKAKMKLILLGISWDNNSYYDYR